MRERSENFELVVLGAVGALSLAMHGIYESLLKELLVRLLGKVFGVGEAELMSRLLEMAIPLTSAIAIVWFLYWYLERFRVIPVRIQLQRNS